MLQVFRTVRRAAAVALLAFAVPGEAREAVVAKSFMVAAAHPLAAEAGYQVLKRGGSALDAAVAVQMVLGLVEPQSSGIGGGAFLLHWSEKEKKLRSYDGRETAPAAARPGCSLTGKQTVNFYAAAIGGALGRRARCAAHAGERTGAWAVAVERTLRPRDRGGGRRLRVLSPKLHASWRARALSAG